MPGLLGFTGQIKHEVNVVSCISAFDLVTVGICPANVVALSDSTKNNLTKKKHNATIFI